MKEQLELVSIGTACRTRVQIEKFLSKKNENYIASTYFFDWLMSGNLNGVINILERDFIITKDDIEVFLVNQSSFIPRDYKSGFYFLHDFGAKNKFFDSHKACEIAIKNGYEESLKKYDYLAKKTRALLQDSRKVTLVYAGYETTENFIRLKKLLEEKFSNKKINIAHILESRNLDHPIKDGSVFNLYVDEDHSPKKGTAYEWEGWDESWHECLEKLIRFKD